MRGLVGRHVTGNLLNASRPRAVIETVAARRFISAKFRISALSKRVTQTGRNELRFKQRGNPIEPFEQFAQIGGHFFLHANPL
jgi:hypothetical protein